ncbi:MAG TPA: VTT domain-containing protein [Gemmatimonadales bacterium]|nr:VTT domain-containing protein [Gemmatimonadales bacterium]
MKLAAFFLIALLVHGPLSPLLPAAIETALLYYTRLYPAWMLAVVGTAAATLAEVANYRLIHMVAGLPRLAALRQTTLVRWSLAAFQRSPFWTTVLVIFSPIPDTAVRILASLGKYPLPRFLLAVALGRFPRLLLIASVGRMVPVPVWVLVAGAVIAIAFTFLRSKPWAVQRPRTPGLGATACLVVALAMNCARAGAGQEAKAQSRFHFEAVTRGW